MREPKATIMGMAAWWRNYQFSHDEVQSRHLSIRGWDAGVLAASELVRRLTDDEELAGAVQLLLSNKLPKPSAEGQENGS